MFENMTFDALLEAGKQQVSNGVIKSEGSLVHNALAAMAYELEKLYIQADWIMKQADPAQADYEHLVILAAARAVYPDKATNAQVRMEADTDIPVGTRFSLSAYNYIVLEELNDAVHNYRMMCEEAGSGPNGLLGALTPIDHVNGLTTATITELLVAGKDATGRDELYQKYINSFKENSFGGNVADYKERLLSFDGVGGVKIYPVWNGPGTVKGVLLGTDYAPVSSYLVEEIQEAMMPEPEEGYGITPIGHTATIVSAEGITVNIVTEITFKSGYSWATLQEQIRNAVEEYLLSIRKEWTSGGEGDFCTVYISRLEAAILNVEGVIDVSQTTINNGSANLVLDSDQVPILGTVMNA